LVAAPVTEVQFIGCAAKRKTQDLMPETDAEHRCFAQQVAHSLHAIRHCCRVAWSIREKNAVRFERQHVSSGRGGWHNGDATPMFRQQAQNVALDAEVVGDDVERRLATLRWCFA
jgi:hypothetical protein